MFGRKKPVPNNMGGESANLERAIRELKDLASEVRLENQGAQRRFRDTFEELAFRFEKKVALSMSDKSKELYDDLFAKINKYNESLRSPYAELDSWITPFIDAIVAAAQARLKFDR